MAVSSEEFIFEKNRLEETKKWIDNRINEIHEENLNLEKKISDLKKSSGGKYNYELDVLLKNQENQENTLEKYKEATENPYFARIDFREKRRDTESFYIGKIGLDNMDKGEEMVIDWRAPIADLYYSGTEGTCFYKAPIGVVEGELSLKRKFIIKNSEILDVFDEGINKIILKSAESNEENELIDDFLKINLESSASKKLKDIVATIQKEQNEIIRADIGKSIIVQGSAGSGKTTVALHRLAYLLYKYKDILSGEDVLVIAPNKLFLDYISDVLPSLGANKVQQKTFENMALEFLKLKYRVYTKDAKLADVMEQTDKKLVKFITNASKIKGSMQYKTIIDRYIGLLEMEDLDHGDIEVFGQILFTSREISRLFMKDLKHLPIGKRKKEIQRYFKGKLREKKAIISEKIDLDYQNRIRDIKESIGDEEEKRRIIVEIYDERDEKKKSLGKELRKVVKEYFNDWQYDNIEKLYLDMYNDEDIFDIITDGKIPEALANYMREELNNNIKSKRIDSDDLAAMLYLKFMVEGVDDELFKHVVIDEAQDYSLLQIYILKYISSGNSFTIVGDTGQSIYYYKGIDDWNKLMDKVYDGNIEYIPLTQSYRSTVEIVNFANKVLEKQENSLKPAKPVLRHGMEPKIINYSKKEEFIDTLDNIVKEVKGKGKTTIAVIGKNLKECNEINKILKKSKYHWELIKDSGSNFKSEYIVIPSYMTKGLEFDCSIVYNCNEENYGNNELDKRLLYVVLTRALHMEYIFYTGDISNLINN
ncbi:AAA family ATPase [Clostridium niameyense]|uniref:AAA family ATPase n=1 Tax=Clostridium niameyense TaxID=1622073 RepID=A0A6M0R7Q8_9CLOT|nr:RNA polymerase recycling motor HelD [Clostridium niameyense]NEZ46235.1 AAA family ATPase [Clostridium niameyense]